MNRYHQRATETEAQAAERILSEWVADFSDATEVGFVARAVLPQLKELVQLRALLATPMPCAWPVPRHDGVFVYWDEVFASGETPDDAIGLGAGVIRAALAAQGKETP